MHGPAYEVLDSPDAPLDPAEFPAEGDDIWCDLRPSEARDLDRIYVEAVGEATAAAERAIVDAFVQAGLRFAEIHPNAPRAKVVAS